MSIKCDKCGHAIYIEGGPNHAGGVWISGYYKRSCPQKIYEQCKALHEHKKHTYIDKWQKANR